MGNWFPINVTNTFIGIEMILTTERNIGYCNQHGDVLMGEPRDFIHGGFTQTRIINSISALTHESMNQQLMITCGEENGIN